MRLIAPLALLAFQFLPFAFTAAENPPPLRIGAILPLSGKEARQGQLARAGLELALDEFKGAFRPHIFYEDSRSDAKEAVAAFNKLLALNKIEVVVSTGSPTAMALLPLVNRAKVVLMVMAVVPGFSAPDDFGFRLMGTASGFSARMVDLLSKEMGKRRIGLLYVEDDYGSGYAKTLIGPLRDAGLLAGVQSYLPETSDYRPALLKLKAAKPDAVILAVWGLNAGVILRQSKEIRFQPGVFACPATCDNPDLIVSGAGATDPMVAVVSAARTAAEREEVIREKFHEVPGSVLLRFFDAIVLLKYAYERCSADSAERSTCLKQSLAAAHDLPGSAFPLRFDGNGDLVDSYQLKLVRGGKFVGARVKNQELAAEEE